MQCRLPAKLTNLMIFPILLGFGIMSASADVMVSQPVSGQIFPAGTNLVTFTWNPVSGASSYKLKLLLNDSLLESHCGLSSPSLALSRLYAPGYYTVLVRAENDALVGAWSEPVTFIVQRQMKPCSLLRQPPRQLTWTRSPGATGYWLKLAQYSAARNAYLFKQMVWVQQPKYGSPVWHAPSGYFQSGIANKWSVTDETSGKRGYTSSTRFSVMAGIAVGPVMIGMGNGGTIYTGQLHSPVVPRSLRIYTDSRVFKDDGDGHLISNSYPYISGLINYQTGTWAINLEGIALPSGQPIKAVYNMLPKPAA